MRTVDPAKHQAKRKHILDSAAGCFALKGFDKTTTADICEAAGISSGSLFHYFPNKRAIFSGIFEEDRRETGELLAVAAASADPWATLLDLVDDMAVQLAAPVVAPLILEVAAQASRDAEFAELIRGNERALREGFSALVRAAAEQGKADPALDPARAGGWIAGLLDALISRAGFEPDLELAEERAMLRLILTRFLSPSG
ncbi:TetR/AcrR family transcriptional regulator [Amycolatopsis sp. H20-H5]|uniref:TetR/AcrR family transcriptional regulator n=1 Tax=Amycolatopsis sp. H20-H5 TaxID=3046309 RepID=UPI002DBBCD18|nr:TetR/AcrR family transcriptional regulator [Amycolatopsis sp. H20-H5]MEC3982160.1 TetR/AcrR family transcriptional regulator [Amycolatopsis sp. H20-H5]